MTSVTITSYSEVTTTAERATLIGTRIAQPGINTNASFSILQNTDIRLSAKISEGTLTAEEIAVIGSSIVTVTVVRTSLFLNNIDCIREVVDYEYSSTFFHFVYLQDKWFDSQYVTFNVTGFLLIANDPLSLRVEHVVMDAYALRQGYVFVTL